MTPSACEPPSRQNTVCSTVRDAALASCTRRPNLHASELQFQQCRGCVVVRHVPSAVTTAVGFMEGPWAAPAGVACDPSPRPAPSAGSWVAASPWSSTSLCGCPAAPHDPSPPVLWQLGPGLHPPPAARLLASLWALRCARMRRLCSASRPANSQ